ncbi:MAG: RNA polymerase sigma factor [Armatimonadota bacterium]
MWSLALERKQVDRSYDQLIEAARAGDRTAFSRLIECERQLVYVYAYAQLGSREEAEDAVQEIFLRAYQSLPRLRGAGQWQPWLMQIARHLCSDLLRRKRVRRTEAIDPDWLDGGASPELQLLTDERRRALGGAVASLPEKYRVPVVMRFGGGCSRREIALALGVPESTVIGRLAGAMRLLRRAVGEEYGL